MTQLVAVEALERKSSLFAESMSGKSTSKIELKVEVSTSASRMRKGLLSSAAPTMTNCCRRGRASSIALARNYVRTATSSSKRERKLP